MDAQPDEHLSLSETALRSPNGVICLIFALEFHGLTAKAFRNRP